MSDLNSFRNHWKQYSMTGVPGQVSPSEQLPQAERNQSVQEENYDDKSLNVQGENHSVSEAEPIPDCAVSSRAKRFKTRRSDIKSTSMYSEPSYEAELVRQYNEHMYDHFWTDNYPRDKELSFMETQLLKRGCSCCIGPCASRERKEDCKSFFLSFTFWITIVEIGFFLAQICIGGLTMPKTGPNLSFFFSLFSVSRDSLMTLGALYFPKIYYEYQFFRYVTVELLHVSVLHIVGNLSMQLTLMLGREHYWGRLRTAAMYIVCGVGSSILSIVFMPCVLSAGASGSLFGIFGAYLVDVARMWSKMSSSLRCQYGMHIGMFLVSAVLMSIFLPFINFWAHIGGFVTGIFFGMIILQRNIYVRLIGAFLLATLFIVPTVLTYIYIHPHC